MAVLHIDPAGVLAVRRAEAAAASDVPPGSTVVLTVQLRRDVDGPLLAAAIDAATAVPGAQHVTLTALAA